MVVAKLLRRRVAEQVRAVCPFCMFMCTVEFVCVLDFFSEFLDGVGKVYVSVSYWFNLIKFYSVCSLYL
jgi:hypothetical protein